MESKANTEVESQSTNAIGKNKWDEAFYTSVKWSAGRMLPCTLNDFSAGKVDIIEVSPNVTTNGRSYDSSVVVFDSSVPIQMREGTVVRFHKGTDNRGFYERENLRKISHRTFTEDYVYGGGAVTLVISMLMSVSLALYSFPKIMTEMALWEAFLAQSLLSAFIFMVAFSVGAIFYKFKPLTARQLKKRQKVGENDELYFFKRGSAVFPLLRYHSKTVNGFTELVKRKLQLGHDAQEVEDWSDTVNALLIAQKTFPVERIPMVSDDVEFVRTHLVSKVAELEEASANEAQMELEAIAHGNEAAEIFDRFDSRMTREGAVAWIDGMTIEEVGKK